MRGIRHRTTTVTVRREGEEIVSEAVWLDKNREYVGQIRAEIDTLLIRDSRMEILKDSGNDMGEGVVFEKSPGFSGLLPSGTKAYMEGKKAAGALKGRFRDGMMKYLMEQCINGVIQAETYFYRERGFESRDEYDEYWARMEQGGCMMYSNPSEDDLPWMDYVPQRERPGHMFNRHKIVTVTVEGGSMICRAGLNDSYHEIEMELLCDVKTGIINDGKIRFERAPGKACFTGCNLVSRLIGKSLPEMRSSDAVEAVGRGEGCYHLVELLKDIMMDVGDVRSCRSSFLEPQNRRF